MADFAEMDGSPIEEWLPNEFNATRKLICDWGDRHAVIQAAGEDGGERYPYHPETEAHAYAAGAEPFGAQSDAGNGMASYEKAIVTIKYSNASNRPSRTQDGKYVTEAITPTAEYLRIAGKSLYWDTDGKSQLTEGEAPQVLLRSFTYTITYHHASRVPAGVMTLVNCVNSAPITSYSLGWTFAPETLLFPAATAMRTVQLGRLNDWQITYHFAFKAWGWNKVWSNAAGNFVYTYLKGSKTPFKPHPPGNFMLLVP